MTKPVSVTLSHPLQGGKVSTLTFRAPRFEDFMELGDPRAPIPTGDGEKVFMRPIPETVKLYAERLLVADGLANVNTMADASLRDSFAIQGAILGFFQAAEAMPKTETTNSSGSAEGSPSTPKKDSATSDA